MTMTRKMRIHIKAGIVIERHRPNLITPNTSEHDILDILDEVVKTKLKGLSIDVVEPILDMMIGGATPISSTPKDPYKHAMKGVI